MQTTIVPVREVDEVAGARRAASQCAHALHFSETAGGRVALAATELATNLVKHAGGGSLLISSSDERTDVVDLLAIDKGKGIANLNAAMRDGFSTAGSYGNGLGSLSRMASVFDAYSTASGTVMLCRIEDPEKAGRASLPMPSRAGQMKLAGICVPIPTETQSGDTWAALRSENRVTITIADGLGHGEGAADASIRAVRAFKEANQHPPVDIIRTMHQSLRATRGAAVGLARVHLDQSSIEYAGIGNISGTVFGDETVIRMVSIPGIVGHEMRKVQPFSYRWTAESTLVMHSDGLSANWALKSYVGLEQRDPMVIAGVLFRDHCRRTDDATVVVLKM